MQTYYSVFPHFLLVDYMSWTERSRDTDNCSADQLVTK